MSEFKIKIERELVKVYIKLKPQGDLEEQVKYMTSDVIKILKERGHEIVNVIHPTMVCNYNPKNYSSEWVFERIMPKPSAPKIRILKEGRKPKKKKVVSSRKLQSVKTHVSGSSGE